MQCPNFPSQFTCSQLYLLWWNPSALLPCSISVLVGCIEFEIQHISSFQVLSSAIAILKLIANLISSTKARSLLELYSSNYIFWGGKEWFCPCYSIKIPQKNPSFEMHQITLISSEFYFDVSSLFVSLSGPFFKQWINHFGIKLLKY